MIIRILDVSPMVAARLINAAGLRNEGIAALSVNGEPIGGDIFAVRLVEGGIEIVLTTPKKPKAEEES